MNTFLHILDYDGKLNKVTNCMLELMVSVFTFEVLNSVIFLVESMEEDHTKKKKFVEEARSEISQKACCKPELVNILSIRPLLIVQEKKKVDDDLEEKAEVETTVSASLKLLNEIARQTYLDPNPFEPEGMDYHDAVAAVESVRDKYQLRDKDWHNVMNHVYTMIPN